MTGRYPDEQELKHISEWDLTKQGVKGLVEFIQSIWEYDNRAVVYKTKDRLFKKPIMRFNLSTGGWSGNEEIIGAMQSNWLFWAVYWYKSQRGGHYWFDIPMAMWK